jgi:predicted RNA-binding protein with PUA-like domain
MKYWLVKSEGDCYSIDHFKKDKRTEWDGIRNYQARNYMKEMSVGDLVLFYHSITEPTGVYGIAKVVSAAHPDSSQFDKKDMHFDPKAEKDKPIWYCVDLGFVEKFKRPITLVAIKHDPKLKGIVLSQKGSRLSVQPVSDPHFKYIKKLGS